jgi:DNA-binding NtrC family response regulator
MPKQEPQIRVLFADSLHTFRFYYGNALRGRGFCVQVARDVLDLWGELSAREFDLVVIDALLLDSDANLLPNIATQYPAVKAVLFTWVITPEMQEQARHGVIAEVLQKGEISPEEMAWRLEGLNHARQKITEAAKKAAARLLLVSSGTAATRRPHKARPLSRGGR